MLKETNDQLHVRSQETLKFHACANTFHEDLIFNCRISEELLTLSVLSKLNSSVFHPDFSVEADLHKYTND